MPTTVLVLIAAILVSFGQVSRRYGMTSVGPLSGHDKALLPNLAHAVLTPFMLGERNIPLSRIAGGVPICVGVAFVARS